MKRLEDVLEGFVRNDTDRDVAALARTVKVEVAHIVVARRESRESRDSGTAPSTSADGGPQSDAARQAEEDRIARDSQAAEAAALAREQAERLSFQRQLEQLSPDSGGGSSPRGASWAPTEGTAEHGGTDRPGKHRPPRQPPVGAPVGGSGGGGGGGSCGQDGGNTRRRRRGKLAGASKSGGSGGWTGTDERRRIGGGGAAVGARRGGGRRRTGSGPSSSGRVLSEPERNNAEALARAQRSESGSAAPATDRWSSKRRRGGADPPSSSSRRLGQPRAGTKMPTLSRDEAGYRSTPDDDRPRSLSVPRKRQLGRRPAEPGGQPAGRRPVGKHDHVKSRIDSGLRRGGATRPKRSEPDPDGGPARLLSTGVAGGRTRGTTTTTGHGGGGGSSTHATVARGRQKHGSVDVDPMDGVQSARSLARALAKQRRRRR